MTRRSSAKLTWLLLIPRQAQRRRGSPQKKTWSWPTVITPATATFTIATLCGSGGIAAFSLLVP
jgi:hypothetical protein